jgi:hypothetical protein
MIWHIRVIRDVGAPRNGIATRPSRDRYRSGINRSVIKSLAGVSYGLLR